MALGRAKIGGKKSQRAGQSDPPLHPYEQQRLMQCMDNNAKLEELGIHHLCRVHEEANSISRKNKPTYRNSEDSESDYDPSQDGSDDDIAIVGSKERNITTAYKFIGTIKLRSKRVLIEPEVTRNTRSKNTLPNEMQLLHQVSTLMATPRLQLKLMCLPCLMTTPMWPMNFMPLLSLMITTNWVVKALSSFMTT